MRYLFLLFFLIMPLQHADSAWFNNAWNYKVKVEVNPNKVGTTTAITSFPVYVDLAGMPSTFWTNASSTGADIRVVESDEITETAFELVSFATTTQAGELHFMADSLGTTSTSTFYIYYGNATATAYAVTATYGRNNVWSNYIAVWHLAETSGNASDYSGNNRTATNTNATYTAVQIGNGADYNGTSAFHAVGDVSALEPASFSWSFWFEFDSQTGNPFLIDRYNAIVADGYRIYGSGTSKINVNVRRSGADVDVTSSSTLSNSTKYYGTATYDNGITRFYLNGNIDGTKTNGTGAVLYNAAATNVGFGQRRTGAAGTYLNGRLDEVRFTSTVNSASWILTEYNNQSSTSTFLWIGPEEARSTSTIYYSDDAFWFE